MTPDVNVLLAASRSDHPHHAPALQWLQDAIVDAGHGQLLRLQPLVLASFLRLATHPRIFTHPTPIWVFRLIVTADSGIVTGQSGIVTGDSDDRDRRILTG